MISLRHGLTLATTTLALAVTLVTAGPAGAGPVSAGPVSTPPGGPVRLTLASQTSWVAPGQDFQLRVGLNPADTTVGTLSVTVFYAVPNRIEFARSINNKIAEGVLSRPLSTPLAALTPDPGGVRTVVIPIQDPTKARERNRLYLSRSGVYPVRIDYRTNDTSTPVSLVTYLLFVAEPLIGPRLDVSWILPFRTTTQPGPAGTRTITPQQSDELTTLATALAANPAVPVVLQPTPDTVAALVDSRRPQDRATLAVLSRPQPGRQLVTGTYVPLPLPGMLAAGLGDDATLQLTRGGDELANALNIRPDGRTWVETGSIDEASTGFLRGAQVDRLIIPEQALSPNPLTITLAQPFQLSVSTGSRVSAVAADADLAAHFSATPDPVLAAHQLLADLADIYLDSPSRARGVVVATPVSWLPDAAFLRVLFDALRTSPVLSAVSLDRLFSTVPAATMRNRPLVRSLVPDVRTSFDAASFPVGALHAARTRLDGFGSALAADNPLYNQFERILLTAESSDLSPQHDRQGVLDLLNGKINEQLALIALPSARTITMTARTGQLPITVQSAADYPLRVEVRLDSDKLSFGANSSRGSAAQTIELHRGNNAVSFQVRARTAGSFPLHIAVLSYDSRLTMAGTSFTVQSTALSGVGLFLSIGAGLFLAAWWGRHALRGRRARHVQRAAPVPAQ